MFIRWLLGNIGFYEATLQLYCGQTELMSCTCGSDEVYRKKIKILQRKYELLRKDHKKLVGVAVELTHALEGYVRGNQTDINNTLISCSKIYPSLFDRSPSTSQTDDEKMSGQKDIEESIVVPTICSLGDAGEAEEEALELPPAPANPEQEYEEGFWSRPRIPRTPQM